MNAAVALALLVPVLGSFANALPDPNAAPAAQDDPVAQEWLVRTAALAPTFDADAFARALEAPRWTERARALDVACRRFTIGASGPPRAFLWRALADEHGEVRTRALTALRLADEPLEATTDAERGDRRELWARLADDVHPGVREALALLLEHEARVRGTTPEVAFTLAADPVIALHEPALRALFLAAGEDDEHQGAHAARSVDELSDRTRALLEAFVSAEDEASCTLLVELAPHAGRALRWLEELCAERSATSPFHARWESFARAGRLAGGRTLGPGPLLRDPAVFERDDTTRGWLLASARGADEALARAFLTTLRDRPDEWLWARAAVESVGVARVLTLAVEVGLHEHPAHATLLLEVAVSRPDWSALDLAPWRSEALVTALGLDRDRARVAPLLAAIVAGKDRALAARALRELAEDADGFARHQDAAWEVWRSWPDDERRRSLGWLPRGVRLRAFEEDVVAFGADRNTRRAASELLAAGRDDAEVRAVLVRWLGMDRAAVARASDEREQRRLALAAAGHARALGGAAAPDAIQALEDTLVFAYERSEELGKVTAAALGATKPGREVLARRLAKDAARMNRRTRIEVALQLAGAHDDVAAEARARALQVLMDTYADAAADLRVRMLPAIGRDASAAAQRFVARRLEVGEDDVERGLAIDVLSRSPTADSVALLRAAYRSQSSIDLRREALRGLARLAARPEQRAELLPFLDAELARCADWATRSQPLVRAEQEVLRADLVRWLLALRDDTTALEDELLGDLLRTAKEDLVRRWHPERGDPGAAEFRARTELLLAGELAERGRLGALLARTPGWERIAGEWLTALAGAAGAEPAAQRRLAEAALVAFDGLRLDDPRFGRLRAARLRMRALLLEHARRNGEAGLVQRQALALLAARRDGSAPRGTWDERFGTRDLAVGRDPVARLETLWLRAAAAQALARGAADEARDLERRAERIGRRLGP